MAHLNGLNSLFDWSVSYLDGTIGGTGGLIAVPMMQVAAQPAFYLQAPAQSPLIISSGARGGIPATARAKVPSSFSLLPLRLSAHDVASGRAGRTSRR